MEDVVSENVSRTAGKDAQRNNILAAKVVAEILKTTLGPKGMDKMLVDSTGRIIVTNDGVTILEEIELDHPAARMLVEIAKTQETEVGDGTTTAVLLAGALLENAEKLLDRKIHPTIIVKGYELACQKSLEILNSISVNVENREVLKKIAQTAMTGKGAEGEKEKLSEIIVKAIEKISNGKELSQKSISIENVTGDSVSDSELFEGFIFEKSRANVEMPSSIENPKILICDFPLEVRTLDSETRISISTPEQLESFIEREESYLRKMTEKIISSGTKVVFCKKGIDDAAQNYFAKSGILACRRISKSVCDKISLTTSAKIVSNLEEINPSVFGNAEKVEEVTIGENNFIKISKENSEVASIILRGGTEQVVKETERAIRDAIGDVISAYKSGKIVAGGGAVEIELAKNLRAFARTRSGKEQIAIEYFASSLEVIPEALSENAGFDPIEVLTELKKQHENNPNYGLDLSSGKIGNTLDLGIIEPLKVKTQAISSASEVARMILRIDDVLMSSRKEKENPLEDI